VGAGSHAGAGNSPDGEAASMSQERHPFLQMLVVRLVRRERFVFRMRGLLLSGHKASFGGHSQFEIDLVAAGVML
jgi:hypothetical protein